MTRKPLAALGLSAAAAVGGSFLASGVASAASTPAAASVAPASAPSLSASVTALGSVAPSVRLTPTLASTAAVVAEQTSSPAAAPVAAAPSTYTVVPGDTLWAISRRFGVSMAGLASANGMDLSDVLFVGKVLVIPTGAAASAPVATTTASTSSSSSSEEGSSSTASSEPSSGFESCVIRSESNGDPDVTNSSGHWGLYQFSRSTWEEYGGSSSSFGSASASEQHAVFDHAVAAGGSSNWSDYDGC